MYYKNKNIKLYYEKYGNKGEVILILPGWGDTRKTFDFLVSNLEKDYIIYIFDYPGFGKSTFPDNDLTIYDYAKIFYNFIQEKNLQNPIIIAHSFGGRISILLSSIYKLNIKKMILIDSAGIKPKKTIVKWLKQSLYKGLKRLRYLLPKKWNETYQKWLLSKFSSADYQALDPKMMPTFRNIVNENLKDYLKDIETETLLIWGEMDSDTPLKDGIKMEKEITNSGLVKIQHATHYCYLEQPIFVLQVIMYFLNEKKRI